MITQVKIGKVSNKYFLMNVKQNDLLSFKKLESCVTNFLNAHGI